MRVLPRDPGHRVLGSVLGGAGLALLLHPALLASAIGIESLAAGFWFWARGSADPARHLPRWGWLRRPAAALWLAVAIEAAWPGPGGHVLLGAQTLLLGWKIQGAAVAWAALELMAGLPLARPFSDLTGPLVAGRVWIPALLPPAGFLLLWRQRALWLQVDGVREAVALLLLVTAVLATLRAFGRQRWTAGLRWLVVCDGALAGVLLTTGVAPPVATLLLWLAASGAHLHLLVAELKGATPRRGPVMATLWRAAAWTTSAALSWPLLVGGILALAPAHTIPRDAPGGAWGAGLLALAALAVALAAWVNVARMLEAPERRATPRERPLRMMSRALAACLAAGVSVAVASGWWVMWSPPLLPWLGALLPAVLGGGLALLTFRAMDETAVAEAPPAGTPPVAPDALARAGRWARRTARWVFMAVITIERRVVRALAWLVRGLVTPLRDLHSGDAQEYVLFLIGVAVLAVLLPLLQ